MCQEKCLKLIAEHKKGLTTTQLMKLTGQSRSSIHSNLRKLMRQDEIDIIKNKKLNGYTYKKNE